MLFARTAVVLITLALSLSARAQVEPFAAYEWVQQSGPNNVIDSNASSCSFGSGCYTPTGAMCSATPGAMCDLQIVPKNRCTYGSLAGNGGPGGTDTCVWPHGAGRCATLGSTSIGCLTDAYIADPNNVASGPSVMCASTLSNTCNMTTDPYGGPFRADCSCSPTPGSPNFEAAICGSPSPICSDGDPDRARGGYGLALGDELNLGASNGFVNLGPIVNGSTVPSTSPRYPLENPPIFVEPQRNAGSIGRGAGATGPIHAVRTTEALEQTEFSGALQIDKLRGRGDSFWSDWSFESQITTGAFNTHTSMLKCTPPAGWSIGAKIDPTPGSPNSGDERYCNQVARDSVSFIWHRNLTAQEQASNPTCPPTCKKDFDLTTAELEAIRTVDALDHNAGVQLALQNGEGRSAGAGDSVGMMPLTLVSVIGQFDGRCRIGGWNAEFVGRCSDGVNTCIPGHAVFGDALCAGQGNQCRGCAGPYDGNNSDLNNGLPNDHGFPPGYSTHGLSDLDLALGQRIGLILGISVSTVRPLMLVATSGYSASEFRDLASENANSLDLADLGPVDPNGPAFGPGIGTGGTFANGVALPVGGVCCANGASIVWPAAHPGTVVPGHAFLRSFDAGPGPDGIPGCFGDNAPHGNAFDACNQRLGGFSAGPKTDGAFNTGLDDVATTFPVGSSGTIPASSARFGASWTCSGPPIPVFNQVATGSYRDLGIFVPAGNDDGLVKLNISYCPMVGGHGVCAAACNETDGDGDGVLDTADDCPTVANFDQADGDGDGVGDVCDNCTMFANPRVAPDFLTANPWATLTGGQRDDDHDGYGNKCDGKFPGVGGIFVGNVDLNQLRASNTRSRTLDLCGSTQIAPCAVFDLDEVGTFIGNGDLARWRLLNAKAAGPKCPSCPKTCTAGTAGSCF